MQASIVRIGTSFIDVPGAIAVAVYFAGCSVRCPGCHNKELWDRSRGTMMSLDTVQQTIATHPLASAVVFLGGEPTDQRDFLTALCMQLSTKKRVLYTGREFEALPPSLTDHIDMIVCGPYKEELHVNRWPASSNQRVLIKEDNIWKIQAS